MIPESSNPQVHTAFELAVPRLGMYIVTHVQNDGHIEVFNDALLVKAKIGSFPHGS